MRAFVGRHLVKILVALVIGVFAVAYYHDQLDPTATQCKTVGGKKLYGECWVPLKSTQLK